MPSAELAPVAGLAGIVLALGGGGLYVYDQSRDSEGSLPFYVTAVPWCLGGIAITYPVWGLSAAGTGSEAPQVAQYFGIVAVFHLFGTVLFLSTITIEWIGGVGTSEKRALENPMRRRTVIGSGASFVALGGAYGVAFDPVGWLAERLADLLGPPDSDDDGVPDDEDPYPENDNHWDITEREAVTVAAQSRNDVPVDASGKNLLAVSILVVDGSAVDVAVAPADENMVDGWYPDHQLAESVREWEGTVGIIQPTEIWVRATESGSATVRIEYTLSPRRPPPSV